MRTTLALLLALCASPLFAQYGPPAKDLEEAQFFMREILRQLEPAMSEARDRAAVFAVVARANGRLTGSKPAEEVAAGKEMLDDFLERRERSGHELSRENLKTIISVRKELELAQPPYDITALRERLHHEFVHPLELQVLDNLGEIDKLESQWEAFVTRHVRTLRRESMNGVLLSAKEIRAE